MRVVNILLLFELSGVNPGSRGSVLEPDNLRKGGGRPKEWTALQFPSGLLSGPP